MISRLEYRKHKIEHHLEQAREAEERFDGRLFDEIVEVLRSIEWDLYAVALIDVAALHNDEKTRKCARSVVLEMMHETLIDEASVLEHMHTTVNLALGIK